MSKRQWSLWEVEQIWADARRSAEWETSRLKATNTLRRKVLPHDPCTTCGTDPTNDLYPRVGALCHWCDELQNIHKAAASVGYSGDMGPMRTSRRYTASTGPRRAPKIPNVAIRQHHRKYGWVDYMVYAMLWGYVAFIIIFMGFMQRYQ